MIDVIISLLLLIGLELILGIDNILVISILVGKLPDKDRQTVRILGLAGALVARILMLYILLRVTTVTKDIIFTFSPRDIVLFIGAMILLWSAIKEIHRTIELKEELSHPAKEDASLRFLSVIGNIILLDTVFSIDSVITAIGLINNIFIIVLAVIISFIMLMFFAKSVGDFVLETPTIRILALAFLITIAVTLFLEGIGREVPKGYIYLPMGFALLVELLQLRYEKNKKKVDKVI